MRFGDQLAAIPRTPLGGLARLCLFKHIHRSKNMERNCQILRLRFVEGWGMRRISQEVGVGLPIISRLCQMWGGTPYVADNV